MSKNNKIKQSVARYELRLFVTGNALNSIIAQENLKILCERFSEYKFDVEIVDVSENPSLAIENDIYLTPALQIIEESGPGTTIFGNLSNQTNLKNLFGPKTL